MSYNSNVQAQSPASMAASEESRPPVPPFTDETAWQKVGFRRRKCKEGRAICFGVTAACKAASTGSALLVRCRSVQQKRHGTRGEMTQHEAQLFIYKPPVSECWIIPSIHRPSPSFLSPARMLFPVAALQRPRPGGAGLH